MTDKIYVVGIGPGKRSALTKEAEEALLAADVIVGYPLYLDLLLETGEKTPSALALALRQKECLSTPMKREEERCRMCFAQAAAGRRTALVCSGDAGIYGLASLMYEIAAEYPGIAPVVIPGVTAAVSGAAVLGAPINNDFCVISLSDLLTPWEQIEKRLLAAARGDFVIVLYNAGSRKRRGHLKKCCDILLGEIEPERPCGYVERIARQGEKSRLLTLAELREQEADMFATVFIGNSATEVIGGRLVTKRGYVLAREKEARR